LPQGGSSSSWGPSIRHHLVFASLPLPAGTVVALAPGKARLALTKLARSVKLGDLVSLTLTVEGTDGTRQDIPVQAEVRMRSPLDDEKRAHHTHAH